MSENALTLSEQLTNVPAFLRNTDAPKGTENVANFMMPSFLRIVQALSAPALREKFSEGDAILQPDQQIVYSVKTGEPVPFTPLLFYTEWCIWNPLKTKGQLPFIRERSTDPNSLIAQKSRNPDARKETCPEMPSEFLRYVEHINFLIQLRTPDAPVLPVVMSFVVAEHNTGRKFCNLIMQRKHTPPLYAGIYEVKTSRRTNAQGNWFGFDITNPSVGDAWCTEEEFELFREQHILLSERLKSGEIKPDYEEGFGPVDPVATGVPAGAKTDTGVPNNADDESVSPF